MSERRMGRTTIMKKTTAGSHLMYCVWWEIYELKKKGRGKGQQPRWYEWTLLDCATSVVYL